MPCAPERRSSWGTGPGSPQKPAILTEALVCTAQQSQPGSPLTNRQAPNQDARWAVHWGGWALVGSGEGSPEGRRGFPGQCRAGPRLRAPPPGSQADFWESRASSDAGQQERQERQERQEPVLVPRDETGPGGPAQEVGASRHLVCLCNYAKQGALPLAWAGTCLGVIRRQVLPAGRQDPRPFSGQEGCPSSVPMIWCPHPAKGVDPTCNSARCQHPPSLHRLPASRSLREPAPCLKVGPQYAPVGLAPCLSEKSLKCCRDFRASVPAAGASGSSSKPHSHPRAWNRKCVSDPPGPLHFSARVPRAGRPGPCSLGETRPRLPRKHLPLGPHFKHSLARTGCSINNCMSTFERKYSLRDGVV
ncbi:uncharacterized protein LOC120588870 [Pteropus medius]|uniref:uncharacterized protein LOC120588870 n=1 Tax=Pteropus vampyrus TaxID=132908 RepID=UPI00196AF7BE|nr:uncharacterized protein LOC120588870 [Pteropus giganteus]